MDELQLARSQVDEEDIALLERLEHGGMQHLERVLLQTIFITFV